MLISNLQSNPSRPPQDDSYILGLTSKITSLTALWKHLGMPPRGADSWRMVINPRRGQFHALPQMCGMEIATDGSVLVLQRDDGKVFFGHITNFEPYVEEREYVPRKKKTADSDSHVTRAIANPLNILLS